MFGPISPEKQQEIRPYIASPQPGANAFWHGAQGYDAGGRAGNDQGEACGVDSDDGVPHGLLRTMTIVSGSHSCLLLGAGSG